MDKNGKSTFGANPEHLKRLLTAIGLDESNPDEQCSHSDSSTKPASSFMEQPGTRIGRYKLITMLGEGGMGIVYLAEQEEPIRRKVALKVIKPGLDSKRVIARFETERQTLAILDHPNIAHVYDAGTTESGRPAARHGRLTSISRASAVRLNMPSCVRTMRSTGRWAADGSFR